MKINFLVRIKNPVFWVTFIPAVILVIQIGASIFGYSINLEELSGKLVAFADAVFAVLAICGVVTDHTTAGLGDSERAMTYTEPSGKHVKAE